MGNATGIREYKGAAVASGLSTGITNATMSFSITLSTNWPTGAGGNFSVVCNPNTSSEEKMLCSDLTGGVLTVVTRGYDNSTAVSHLTGAVIYPCVTAIDISEANYIANTASQTSKGTPVDADVMPLFDSADSNNLKKLTWANLKATLLTYFSTLYILKTLTTTTGDMIIASGANTPARLAVGSTAQGLGIIGGLPAWVNGLPTLENPQTGTTYTPVLGDAFKMITLTNAGTIAVSIPTDASVNFEVGTVLAFEWEGVGQPTISATTPGTTTILSGGATPAAPKIRARYSTCIAWKKNVNEWRVYGDIA